MTPREYLEILHVAERLKDTTRHCTTSGRRVESVAEHSWRVALMAFLLKDEFPEADLDKVYAFDTVAFSPWLMDLRKEILKDTLEKIGD